MSMNIDQKRKFWNSLTAEGKEQLKDNIDNFKLLLERFDLTLEETPTKQIKTATGTKKAS